MSDAVLATLGGVCLFAAAMSGAIAGDTQESKRPRVIGLIVCVVLAISAIALFSKL